LQKIINNTNNNSGISCYHNDSGGINSQSQFFENLIWGIDDVCHFTKYAKGTVYNLVSQGEIPYRRGRKRKLVFIPSEIINWFKGE
jgi:predicted DNA-binding transcriptional regulator AlpA